MTSNLDPNQHSHAVHEIVTRLNGIKSAEYAFAAAQQASWDEPKSRQRRHVLADAAADLDDIIGDYKDGDDCELGLLRELLALLNDPPTGDLAALRDAVATFGPATIVDTGGGCLVLRIGEAQAGPGYQGDDGPEFRWDDFYIGFNDDEHRTVTPVTMGEAVAWLAAFAAAVDGKVVVP